MCSDCREELERIKVLIKADWAENGRRWVAIRHTVLKFYETIPEISVPLIEEQIKNKEIEIVFTL